MKKTQIFFPFLCLAISMSSLTAQDVVDGFHAREYRSKTGDTLHYRLFVPANHNDEMLPLVVYLHGGGGWGTDNLRQISGGNTNGTHVWIDSTVQQKHSTFVLAPQSPPRRRWSALDSKALAVSARLMLELIEALQQEFNIDENRLYLTGQSLGGAGTWDIITKRPDVFAAAVPLCGRGNPSAVETILDIPIWVFHGKADPIVSVDYSREMVDALRASGSTVKYTEYPEVVHSVWLKAYKEPELIEWLFAQKKEH
jgi:predicted peptidase